MCPKVLIFFSIVAICLYCHDIPNIPSEFVAYIDTKMKIFGKSFEGRERLLYSLKNKILRSDSVIEVPSPMCAKTVNMTVIENYNQGLKYIIDHGLKSCHIENLSKPFTKFKVPKDAFYDGTSRNHNISLKSWRSTKTDNGFNITQVFSFGINSDRFYNLYTKLSNGQLLEKMDMFSKSLANLLKSFQDEVEVDQYFEHTFRVYPPSKEFVPPSYCNNKEN